MQSALETHPSLLVRLRNPGDAAAWERFAEVYAPVVFEFLRGQGLQDADAADLTQEVMVSALTALQSFSYDCGRGSFRGWLFAVVQNCLRDYWRRAPHRPVAVGGTNHQQRLAEEPDGEDGLAPRWQREYERRLFHAAGEQVRGDFRETSWKAFWQTAVEGRTGAEVADELGLSVDAVYMAKSRVMKRIQQQIRLLEEE